jgi:creatinine amidohydrolase/Fe(II)-dependent formamide hydrolase-like protein
VPATDTFSAQALVEGICDQIEEVATVQLPVIWCSRSMDYSKLGSDLKRGKISVLFENNQHLMPEGGLAQVGWTTSDLSEDGVIGCPDGATAEDGEWVLQKTVDLGSAAMREITAFTYESNA